jgi:hypothetical protein
MKKRNPSSGQNGQLVHWWLLIHSGPHKFPAIMNKGCGLAIYIKKYLKAKEEVWKFKYFTMKKYNLQKNPCNLPKLK